MKVFVCFPELCVSECFHPILMNCILYYSEKDGQKAGLTCKSEWDKDLSNLVRSSQIWLFISCMGEGKQMFTV